MAKYKALNRGTLNYPYRVIEEGQIVDESELPAGYHSKWLIPIEDALKRPVLPITSADKQPKNDPVAAISKIQSLPNENVKHAPQSYEGQMARVIKNEHSQDAHLKAAAGDTLIELSGEGTGQGGTGDQEPF